jgi:hypothetical protein
VDPITLLALATGIVWAALVWMVRQDMGDHPGTVVAVVDLDDPTLWDGGPER